MSFKMRVLEAMCSLKEFSVTDHGCLRWPDCRLLVRGFIHPLSSAQISR